MKKKLSAGLAVGMMMFGMAGIAHATLITIGTAGYDSNGDSVKENYNLIWDNDNNGNSVVWLDYSNAQNNWQNQMNWANSLNAVGVLTYNLFAGYCVEWVSNWRLPAASDPGGDENLNQTSEMGHLFYEYAPPHSVMGGSTYDGNTIGIFKDMFYWSNTLSTRVPAAWGFDTSEGQEVQFSYSPQYMQYDVSALAIRTGQVTFSNNVSVNPVPEPATMLLMGTGLAGLVGARRKKKK